MQVSVPKGTVNSTMSTYGWQNDFLKKKLLKISKNIQFRPKIFNRSNSKEWKVREEKCSRSFSVSK